MSTTLRWAHATNTKAKLQTALQDDHITAIEVDILMGQKQQQLNDDETTSVVVPILSHPPSRISDLTVEDFLKQVLIPSRNDDDQDGQFHLLLPKTIKLDIKEPDAVEPTLACLGHDIVSSSPSIIIVLNADILPGPGKRNGHMPTDFFLQSCLKHIQKQRNDNDNNHHDDIAPGFNPVQYQLSLGYTVDYRTAVGGYTPDDVKSMMDVIQRYHHPLKDLTTLESITLALNARVLAQRPNAFQECMMDDERLAILIWTGTGEPAIAQHEIDTILECYESDRISLDCLLE